MALPSPESRCYMAGRGCDLHPTPPTGLCPISVCSKPNRACLDSLYRRRSLVPVPPMTVSFPLCSRLYIFQTDHQRSAVVLNHLGISCGEL